MFTQRWHEGNQDQETFWQIKNFDLTYIDIVLYLSKYLDIFAKAVKFGDERWLNGFREPLLLSRMFK